MGSISIIGGGLAGCEVALQLARFGVSSRLYEMKPKQKTPAQVLDGLAELVCSNSFRAAGIENAVGAIKEEMRFAGSILMQIADETSVPAGGALAVDRELFSQQVTERIQAEPLIECISEEVTELPENSEDEIVIATGPLTSDSLAKRIEEVCGGQERLFFYDAIAPIVSADSIDYDIAYRASRYGKGEGDEYLNLPMNEEQYLGFVDSLLKAEKVTPREFEEAKYFEGCLPIEVIASRGVETLRFGCMKPVGLPDPKTGKEAHAVVQLRAENREYTAYNLVGFQTRMKWGAQQEVFRSIPGLAQVEFLRMGSIHRNTYIDSPRLLDEQLRLKTYPHLIFAGQITGVEGYVESLACGFLVGLMLAAKHTNKEFVLPPRESALGALHAHILGLQRDGEAISHVPSNIHWGLVPALGVKAKKKDRKVLMGKRAVEQSKLWWSSLCWS